MINIPRLKNFFILAVLQFIYYAARLISLNIHVHISYENQIRILAYHVFAVSPIQVNKKLYIHNSDTLIR